MTATVMDANRLTGMTVVSVAEGARLGTITDVVFDSEPLRVAGLRVRGDGNDFVIPFDAVRSLGVDAVTVESSEVTQMSSAGDTFDSLPRLTQLLKVKVVDDAGTLIGTPQTIELEPVTGRVVQLTVHKGGVLGLGGDTSTIAAAAVRSVGADIMTVEAVAPESGG